MGTTFVCMCVCAWRELCVAARVSVEGVGGVHMCVCVCARCAGALCCVAEAAARTRVVSMCSGKPSSRIFCAVSSHIASFPAQSLQSPLCSSATIVPETAREEKRLKRRPRSK